MSKTTSSSEKIKRRKATTPEAREQQIAAAAYDLAEQQILEGTASSQTINYFLKAGSTMERLEKELKEKQKELMDAKTETLKSAQKYEEMVTEAINAFKKYSGQEDEDEYY